MPESPRLNLSLSADAADALAELTADTGYSRSAVASMAIGTMRRIRQHGKGRALVIIDKDRVSEDDVVVLTTI